MANPYKDGGVAAKAKMKRMLGQEPGKNVGKFADAPASEDEIKRFTSGYDIRLPGGNEKSRVRLDRRARGGAVQSFKRGGGAKKKGHTTVNVLVGGHGAPQPTPGPMPVPGRGGGAPVPPPAPPMAAPPMGAPLPGAGAMPPPGMGGAPGMPPRPPMMGGPGMPPPGMPGRKRGGKVAGDWPPASTKHTPRDKPKRGQDNWKVARTKPRGQKNMPAQKNKP